MNFKYSFIVRWRYANVDSLFKTGYLITSRLVRSLNASVEYKIVNTWGYGDIRYKDKLTGMMGHLLRKEVDIAGKFLINLLCFVWWSKDNLQYQLSIILGTVLFMTPERVAHIEFLSVIIPTRAFFVFRAPPLSYVSNIYYLPFTGIVWLCTIVLVFLSTFLIFLTFHFSQKKKQHFIITDFMLFAIGTVCQMGTHLSPKRLSGKLTMVKFPCLIKQMEIEIL